MPITYVDSNAVQGGASTTSPAVAKPAVTNGDVLFLLGVSFQGAAPISSWSATGFINVGTVSPQMTYTSNFAGMALFARAVDGTEGSTFIMTCTQSVSWSLLCIGYDGVDTVTMINDRAGNNTGVSSNTSFAVNGVSPTIANTMLVCFFGAVTPATIGAITAPGGMTNRDGSSGGASTATASRVADETRSGTGATGTRTASSATSEYWAGISLALTPSSGGRGPSVGMVGG